MPSLVYVLESQLQTVPNLDTILFTGLWARDKDHMEEQ